MTTSPNNFEIKFSYVAWVPPLKTEDDPVSKVTSKLLEHGNEAFQYFINIFDKSIDNCKIQIKFKSDDEQTNPVRKKILDLLNSDSIEEKRKFADELSHRLAKLTDHRNGTGLFVIIVGKKATSTRLIFNRFKEDEVVFSNIEGDTLVVKLLQQAFSKKSRYYKLAVYEDILSDRSFWQGFAIDKQITANSSRDISDYWIKEFLDSEPAINTIQGTRSFSKLMRNVLKKVESIEEQEQVISGILALKHRPDDFISVETFCDTYLSPDLKVFVRNELKDEYTFRSNFQIHEETYITELGSKVTGLENGIIVSAPTFLYDEYVEEEELENGQVKLTVKGKIKNKKINRATV